MARVFDTPIITNDQSVERVLAAGLPVVFVFTAGHVPAGLEGAMNNLAREHAGQLLLVQVPIKDSPSTARLYQVEQFPAVVTVRQRDVLSRAEAISGADLEAHVAFLLDKGPRPQPGASQPPPAFHAAGPQARPASASPVNVSAADFDREVLGAPQPVLVDFWAPWCGPCRMTDPILKKLAHEMAGRLRVVKVNVDENQALAQRYEVQSIPTMLVVKNGQIADRWVGALPENALRSRVQNWL